MPDLKKTIPRIQKNDTITVSIEDMNNLGAGVAHLQNADGSRGQTVFVTGAVTGDTVTAKVIKVNQTYLVAKTETVLFASPYRSEDADCTASGCGGCVYRCVQYAHELERKQNYVRQAFRKAGLTDVSVGTVRSTGTVCGYRNKAQFPVQNGKHGMESGFFAASSHRLVPVSECALQPHVFAELTAAVCRFCDRYGIKAYEETSGTGLLRHIYLRWGNGGEELMVCLVINGETFPHAEVLVRELTSRFPQIRSILLNIHTARTNVVLGDTYRLLWGRDRIEDTLCGLRFSIAPAAFYQVNHDACELLYETVRSFAALTGEETLLDLYCGIGTIGLSMARSVKQVIGIEIVEEAVRCATQNAAQNGITNAAFYCGDAKDTGKLLLQAEAAHGTLQNATVILDPPRKGSTPELISYLADRGFEKIVYVSCNPDTLARDCVLFRSLGYEIGEVIPVDMFPRTGHVETVCLLSKLQNRQHIEIELNMDELDVTDAEKKATYPEIKDYVLEHYDYKIPGLYIAQVKQKCGIIERENYNKSKCEHPRQAKCPPEKEAAIMEALRHFGMV